MASLSTIGIGMNLKLAPALFCLAPVCLAQALSDAEIQAAIDHGKTSTQERLLAHAQKKQHIRINRPTPRDPVGKAVTFFTDSDRIAIFAAQNKNATVELVRRTVPLGIVEVLFEASSYNNLNAGSLAQWGPEGGLKFSLIADGLALEPTRQRSSQAQPYARTPQEPGIAGRGANEATYVPLYRIAVYEQASQRTWYTYPAWSKDVKTLTVGVTSGEGKSREKQATNPLK